MTNASGKVLATGSLGQGDYIGGGLCQLPFRVGEVETGTDHYRVEIQGRGAVVVPADQAKGKVKLSIGTGQ